MNNESDSGLIEAPTTIKKTKSARAVVNLVYILQAISCLIGFTAIVAVIINNVKKTDVDDSLLESHFRWQIETFWLGLIGIVVGSITAFWLIGYIILLSTWIWVIYRVTKGWLRLNDDRNMYDATSSRAKYKATSSQAKHWDPN